MLFTWFSGISKLVLGLENTAISSCDKISAECLKTEH